jgi:hypothetical protein
LFVPASSLCHEPSPFPGTDRQSACSAGSFAPTRFANLAERKHAAFPNVLNNHSVTVPRIATIAIPKENTVTTHRCRAFLFLTKATLALVALCGCNGAGPAPVTFEDSPAIQPRGYVCYRAAGPIVLDGRIDEAAWRAAPWSEDFGDIEGDRKPKPRYRTRVKMLWDDRGLYLAAELEEPHVWATIIQHDAVIFHDNDFEVFLDPDGDSHLYAELELNARNTTWDLLLPRPYKDGGKAIDAWEITGLKTAVHVQGTLNDPRDTDRGWSVEIFWPWRGLTELNYKAVPPRDGEQWRINFSRVEWKHEVVEGKYRKVKDQREDNWVWSPQGVIDMHRPERWGYVQFSKAAGGTDGFRRDPAEPARYLLHRIYYAQRDYQKARGRWATSLADLGLADLAAESQPPKLETTSTNYEASVAGRSLEGKPRRWHINSEARVWAE